MRGAGPRMDKFLGHGLRECMFAAMPIGCCDFWGKFSILEATVDNLVQWSGDLCNL